MKEQRLHKMAGFFCWLLTYRFVCASLNVRHNVVSGLWLTICLHFEKEAFNCFPVCAINVRVHCY